MTDAIPRVEGRVETARAAVDVLIPAYNERHNLPHAIRSVIGWANKVIVLDSGSNDGTQQIGRELGATVVEHPWEGYARQKNWGLDNLDFESPWVLILDADESVTPKLQEEITRLCNAPPDSIAESGFYINRSLMFMGRPIRHCGYFPSWNLRLFRRGAARYEDRPVHEHMILEGRAGHLKGLLHHEDRRGLEYYITKHNRYSTLEAETLFSGWNNPGIKSSLLGNSIERRRFFKSRIYPKLPLKWLGRFIWMYFIKLGFLDGATGWRFCLLISAHELFTSLKLRELKDQARQADAHAFQGTAARQIVSDLVSKHAAVHSEDLSSREEITEPHAYAIPQGIAARRRSTWAVSIKIKRVAWMFVAATLFRRSFHNWYAWRRLLLRCFGAKIGRHVRIRPTAHIEIPWNLTIGDDAAIGDHAILYALGKITIGRFAVISQYAHLCAGTHDYTVRRFPLLCPPISVGEEVWIAADAFVGPGVTVGDRSVVAARSTVVRDVPADQVVAGNPARVIKPRVLRD